MHTPLIRITVFFVAGLLLGHGFLYFPFSAAALAVLTLIAAAILIVVKQAPIRSPIVALLSFLAGMLSYIYSAAYVPSDHYLRVLLFDHAKHEIVGRIVSPLDRDPGRTSFVIAATSIDGTAVSGRMRASVRDEQASAGYGDTVRIFGRVYEPRGFRNPGGFDYAEHLGRQGIHAAVSAADFGAVHILDRAHGIFRKIQDRRERIRRHFLAGTNGPGSAILRAMVLGEEGGLTDQVRDRFMAAGVTHILSISGSHLGLVALVCYGFMRWLLLLLPERLYLRLTLRADPKKIAAACTLLPVIFYAFLAGGQTATLRSLVMILAALAAVLLDRENGLMHSLAAAALAILVVSPQAVFDISFQLSYLSVLSIGFVVTVWNELAVPAEGRLRKTGRSAALLILVSLTASLATGPLVAHYFNQVSLAGIVSNLVVVPFAGFVVVPIGLISGVLSLVLGHLPLPALNQTAADMFYGLVTFFSQVPLAEFHPPSPGIPSLLFFGIFFVSAAAYARARLFSALKPFESSQRVPKLPVIAMVLSGAFLLSSAAALVIPKSEARITFLDVGQGDCALIELPSGKNILIDAGGTHDNRFDMGRRVVAPYLWDNTISKLDLVILSHPHPDHMNGLFFILNRFRIGEFWDSGLDRDLPGSAELQRIITDRRIQAKTVAEGHRESLPDGTDVSVLLPGKNRRTSAGRKGREYASQNNRSLVVLVKVRGKTILFTGDIGAEAVTELARRSRAVRTVVLKVPHHGSKYSAPDELLSLTRPAVAVVPVGRGNPYHHPSPAVIDRYEQGGVRLFRTDRDGAVIVTPGEEGLRVVAWADLIVERITLDDVSLWGVVERKNWGKLRKRIQEGA
jgi:competence protein ComEC